MSITAQMNSVNAFSASIGSDESMSGSVKFGGSAPLPRTVNIVLLASKWKGTASPYSQVVTVDGSTVYSKVDLLPSVDQLVIFHEKDLAFVAENEDGVITVFAVGDKPTGDYTIQVMVTEVRVE